jgi:hypothetical protein
MTNLSNISKHTVSSKQPKKTISFSFNTQTIAKLLLVAVLLVLAFIGGVFYSNHQNRAIALIGGDSVMHAGGSGLVRRNGIIGNITAVSSSTITLTSLRSDQSKTYKLNSSTKIIDDGQIVQTNQLNIGEKAIVITSSATTDTATTIIVNPAFGGL